MLSEYKHKRDFKKTPEPSGGVRRERAGANLLFVIQKHDATRLHYDFRLEVNGVMVSWAVPKGPSLKPVDKRLAVMTEDHPMEYNSFEGIIPEHQYGAGEVIIWDRGAIAPQNTDGSFEWSDRKVAQKIMQDGIKKGKVTFFLRGEKLEGAWTLARLHGKDKEWLLIKKKDEFANQKIDVTEQEQSVVSGRTIADLQAQGADSIWTRSGAKKAERSTTGMSKKMKTSSKSAFSVSRETGRTKKSAPRASADSSRAKSVVSPKNFTAQTTKDIRVSRFPEDIPPMLATLADEPFVSDEWIFEPKLDGIRMIAYVRDGIVTLRSRRGLDLTAKYPAICKSLSGYDDNLIFDGEAVVLDENGRPSFQQMQQSGTALRYYVFDILYANDRKLFELPYTTRRQILSEVLRPDTTVKAVESLGGDGEAAFRACAENGLEGIVGKKMDAPYEPGKRTRSWLKVKTALSSEFVICGFTEGTGARSKSFGSLILGEYDREGKLRYVGGVGTGFSETKLKKLLSLMRPLEVSACPFGKPPRGKLNPTWVKPRLVAEVKYMERTADMQLRAPVFMRLREDIEPKAAKAPVVVHVASTNNLWSQCRTADSDSSTKDRTVAMQSDVDDDLSMHQMR
jgi:bifunctional non-homologous end joining protein LigD